MVGGALEKTRRKNAELEWKHTHTKTTPEANAETNHICCRQVERRNKRRTRQEKKQTRNRPRRKRREQRRVDKERTHQRILQDADKKTQTYRSGTDESSSSGIRPKQSPEPHEKRGEKKNAPREEEAVAVAHGDLQNCQPFQRVHQFGLGRCAWRADLVPVPVRQVQVQGLEVIAQTQGCM